MSESQPTVDQVQPGREQEWRDLFDELRRELAFVVGQFHDKARHKPDMPQCDQCANMRNLLKRAADFAATPSSVPADQRAGMIQCNQCHHWWVKFEWQTGPTSYCRVPNCNCKCTSLVGPDEADDTSPAQVDAETEDCCSACGQIKCFDQALRSMPTPSPSNNAEKEARNIWDKAIAIVGAIDISDKFSAHWRSGFSQARGDAVRDLIIARDNASALSSRSSLSDD